MLTKWPLPLKRQDSNDHRISQERHLGPLWQRRRRKIIHLIPTGHYTPLPRTFCRDLGYRFMRAFHPDVVWSGHVASVSIISRVCVLQRPSSLTMQLLFITPLNVADGCLSRKTSPSRSCRLGFCWRARAMRSFGAVLGKMVWTVITGVFGHWINLIALHLSSSGMIKQFLHNVHWGELDYLVIDTPPGTSDEHITVVQLLKNMPSVSCVLVTTPQVILALVTCSKTYSNDNC
jgi:hypothetical protein